MTMFTRNDKTPEQSAGDAARSQAAPVMPSPRPQATAQTLSTHAAPATLGVSLISKALKITGQLESTEDIRIDGEVDGDVKAVAVSVGPNAKVKGTVRGDAVELAGTVEGRIEAKKVVLAGTARMTGDVVHQDIRIESGAYIDGHLKPEYGKGESRGVAALKPVSVRETKPADNAARA